jgi:hypothetical protein
MTLNPGKKGSGDTAPKVVADGDELYKSFLDQVNEAADEQRKQDILDTLLPRILFEASRNMFPVYCSEFKEEDSLIFDSILAQAGTTACGGS